MAEEPARNRRKAEPSTNFATPAAKKAIDTTIRKKRVAEAVATSNQAAFLVRTMAEDPVHKRQSSGSLAHREQKQVRLGHQLSLATLARFRRLHCSAGFLADVTEGHIDWEHSSKPLPCPIRDPLPVASEVYPETALQDLVRKY